MKPLALWITLVISSGPQGLELERVDAGGALLIEMPITHTLGLSDEFARAMALGPLVIADPKAANVQEVLAHELQHVRQWEALGPGLALAYLMGGGREFEDYLGDGTMWEPGEPRHCPLFRWEGGDTQFMPCWRF